MLKPLIKSIRQGLTAILLLVVLLIGVEAVMQWNAQNSVRAVCDHVCHTQQALLVPSPTVHHDNPRLDRITIGDVVYRFDAAGFRVTTPEESDLLAADSNAGSQHIPTTSRRSTSPLKIAVLGDERIFGVGLNDEDCSTSRLQWFLNSDPQANVEVINAAVPGYCPLLSLLKYRQDVREQSPDIVILHVDYSDIADDAIFRRYLKKHPDSGAACTHPDLKNAARQKNRLVELANQSKLAQFVKGQLGDASIESPLRRVTEQYAWTLPNRASESVSMQIRHALLPVAELAVEVEQQGAVLLLSCSPLPWQVGTPDQFPHLKSQVPDSAWSSSNDAALLLQAMAQRLDLPFCNPTNQFAAFSQPQRLYQDDSVELSRFGALLYARELAGFLLKQQAYQERKTAAEVASRQGSIPNGYDREKITQ
ncbi:MAG: SGNH/GDSL hydrolase family protein [Fuerstiella sp.]